MYLDDFFKKTPGVLILYSLKNPSFYEYIYHTETGCMCLDFHQDYPYLIAAGMYDGSVNVFDLRMKNKKEPRYSSTIKSGKHKDPVWQVWKNNIFIDYFKTLTITG